MTRERISLISEEESLKVNLESQIRAGEITAGNFSQLPAVEQEQVKDILFEMSSSQIDSNEGTSTLEFIVMAFIRISTKKMNGISLNSEDVKVEKQLQKILDMHEVTNGTPMKNWLFDYMSYAQYKTGQFLNNRKEHIERKKNVTGEV